MWLFTGQKDSIVAHGTPLRSDEPALRSPSFVISDVVKKAKMFYEYYVTDEDGVKLVNNISAEHAWITDKYILSGSSSWSKCNTDLHFLVVMDQHAAIWANRLLTTVRSTLRRLCFVISTPTLR